LPQTEISILNIFVAMIDLASAAVIVGYCAVGLVTAIRSGRPAAAHVLVARGAILGLSMKTVVSLLKAMELQTWDQILMFALVFTLRMVLKRVFEFEKRFSPGEVQQKA
jgi:hypothetical protein